MQNAGMRIVAEDFMRKMDAGLSERRLLEEIGRLSCDELASVLVMWHRGQMEAHNGVHPGAHPSESKRLSNVA
jgi:hypothetical protein